MKLTLYIQHDSGERSAHSVTRISKADTDWMISYTVIVNGMRQTRKIKLSEAAELKME